MERVLRLLLARCVAVSIGALGAVSALHGIDRGDVFQIAIICTVWLTLIAADPLVAVVLSPAPARRGLPPPENGEL
jgi:cation transporter-like permease